MLANYQRGYLAMAMVLERSDGVVYAGFEGRIDGDSADLVYSGIMDSVSEGDRVYVMDMSKVWYVSSAGLQTFLSVAKSLRDRNVNFRFVFSCSDCE